MNKLYYQTKKLVIVKFIIICLISSTASAQFKIVAGINSSYLDKTNLSQNSDVLFGIAKYWSLFKPFHFGGELDYSRKAGTIEDVYIEDFADLYKGNLTFSIPLIEAFVSLKIYHNITEIFKLKLLIGYGKSISMDGIDGSKIIKKEKIENEFVSDNNVYGISHDPPWSSKNSSNFYCFGVGTGLQRFEFMIRYKRYMRDEYWIKSVAAKDRMFSIEYLISMKF